MAAIRLRQELADTGIITYDGKEVARLNLRNKLIIDPYAFFEIVSRRANKTAKRCPYAFIYETFGKSGTKYPDREVKALIDDMERRKLIHQSNIGRYIIPLVYYPLNDDTYPPYVSQREALAGLEPVDE